MTAKILPLVADCSGLSPLASRLAAQKKAPGTVDSYRVNVAQFEKWLVDNRREADPVSLCDYLAVLHSSGCSRSKINQAYCGCIDWMPSLNASVVRDVLDGIKREHAHRAIDTKKAFMLADVERVLSSLDSGSLRDCRDKALFSVIFATASRKAELLNLTVENIVVDFDRIWIDVVEKNSVTLRRKFLPGAPGDLSVPLAPSTHLMEWLRRSEITSGPIWKPISKADNITDRPLSKRGYDAIFKRVLTKCGFEVSDFSPHSTRAGFITWASKAGVSLGEIMAVTGHKSVESIKHYLDKEQMAENHPLLKGSKS